MYEIITAYRIWRETAHIALRPFGYDLDDQHVDYIDVERDEHRIEEIYKYALDKVKLFSIEVMKNIHKIAFFSSKK